RTSWTLWWTKTWSMTSSIGGSSTVRSSSGRSASMRAVTLGAWAMATRARTRACSHATTPPQEPRSTLSCPGTSSIAVCRAKRRQLQQGGQLVKGAAVLGVREPIDRSVQLERVNHGNIPVEPIALAHHEGDLPQERLLTPPGDVP